MTHSELADFFLGKIIEKAQENALLIEENTRLKEEITKLKEERFTQKADSGELNQMLNQYKEQTK